MVDAVKPLDGRLATGPVPEIEKIDENREKEKKGGREWENETSGTGNPLFSATSINSGTVSLVSVVENYLSLEREDSLLGKTTRKFI